MLAGSMKLLALLGRNETTFNIPVYQRNYEWNKEQVEQYFKDIEKIADSEFKNGHFMGTIVFVSHEKQGLMMENIIIDGQQRITTTVLLLKAIHDLLDENASKEKALREKIFESYIINKHSEEQYKLKLKPVEHDMKVFNELLEYGTTNKDSKIFTNYNLFIDLIRSSKYTAQEIYDALTLVEIVYISLEQNSRTENPQLIFESLNSTGLSLTQADLIRNFILMGLEYNEQTNLYRKYWTRLEYFLPNAKISEFVRDFLTMKTGTTPNKNKVYLTFKGYYNTNRLTSKEILEELLRFSRYYHWFINVNIEENDINEYIWKLGKLRSTVVYPYLLELFDDYYEKGIISKEDLISTLKIINSYLYRRSICGLPTNALNKVFASMAKSVSKLRENGISHIDSVIDYLMSKKGSAIFPRDEQFKTSFIELDIYNKGKELALLSLFSIESHCHKEVVEFENLTIEHIMPQTLTPKWSIDLGRDSEEIHRLYKDTIGNLTITKLNSEISNRSFEEKKTMYIESNIKLTRDIAEFDKWNKDSILRRANNLFQIAKEIWEQPFDKYTTTKQDVLIPNVEYSINENLNVTGTKPATLIIGGEMKSVASWKDMLMATCSFLLEYDQQLFRSLLFNRNFNKIISKSGDEFRRKEQLAEDIFLEVNFSAKDILNCIRLLTEEFNLEDEFEFTIRY